MEINTRFFTTEFSGMPYPVEGSDAWLRQIWGRCRWIATLEFTDDGRTLRHFWEPKPDGFFYRPEDLETGDLVEFAPLNSPKRFVVQVMVFAELDCIQVRLVGTV